MNEQYAEEDAIRARLDLALTTAPASTVWHVLAALEHLDAALADVWDEGHRDGCDDHMCVEMGHLGRNPRRVTPPAKGGA